MWFHQRVKVAKQSELRIRVSTKWPTSFWSRPIAPCGLTWVSNARLNLSNPQSYQNHFPLAATTIDIALVRIRFHLRTAFVLFASCKRMMESETPLTQQSGRSICCLLLRRRCRVRISKCYAVVPFNRVDGEIANYVQSKKMYMYEFLHLSLVLVNHCWNITR